MNDFLILVKNVRESCKFCSTWVKIWIFVGLEVGLCFIILFEADLPDQKFWAGLWLNTSEISVTWTFHPRCKKNYYLWCTVKCLWFQASTWLLDAYIHIGNFKRFFQCIIHCQSQDEHPPKVVNSRSYVMISYILKTFIHYILH